MSEQSVETIEQISDRYAFNRGVKDGRAGVGCGRNPYCQPDSRYYQYQVGYSSGYSETHEEDEDVELSPYQELLAMHNGPGTHAWAMNTQGQAT